MQYMRDNNRIFSPTASTGMSRLQYLNGKTLHSRCGYGDGHLNLPSLMKNIESSPLYTDTRKNITECKTLFIDEIGMISYKMLTAVEIICRSIKGNDLVFGGMQVIGAGSFFQLPPVPSALDNADYCFKAQFFKQIFPHVLNLKQVFRQKDVAFINAVNEICRGVPSEQTLKLIEGLKRPLDNYDGAVFIFGTNFDCNYFNHMKLMELQDREFTFRSSDKGNKHLLKNITCPKILVLKPNCKVIIIRNMANGLVNGISATVNTITDDEIEVTVDEDVNLHHDLGGKKFKVHKEKFHIRDETHAILATRIQFPLKLGYAITVDKAQGRTINKVCVYAQNFRRPGQLGVAIGRAKDISGLQVLNFQHETAFLKHSKDVTDFYNCKSDLVRQSRSCCTHIAPKRTQNFLIRLYEVQDIERNQLHSEGQIHDVSITDVHEEEFPFHWESFIEDNLLLGTNDIQKERNDLLLKAADTACFKKFCIAIYTEVQEMFALYRVPTKKTKCNWCVLSNKLHEFLKSTKYLQLIRLGFNITSLKSIHNRIATQLAFSILTKLSVKAKETLMDDIQSQVTEVSSVNLNVDQINVLRYIAGTCLKYLSKKMQTACSRTLFGKTYKSKCFYKANQLLGHLCTTEQHLIETTTEPQSLLEVIRRQKIGGGLTFVTDEAFTFFKTIYLELKQLQSRSRFERNLSVLYHNTVQLLKTKVKLIEMWYSLFSTFECVCPAQPEESQIEHEVHDDMEYVLQETLVMELYDHLVEYFTKINISELIKKYLDEVVQKAKSVQLRHSVNFTENKKDIIKDIKYPCGVCFKECEEIETLRRPKFSDFSVECSTCNKWFHYQCVQLSGSETFLQEGSMEEFTCTKCSVPNELSTDENAANNTETTIVQDSNVNAVQERQQAMAAEQIDKITSNPERKVRKGRSKKQSSKKSEPQVNAAATTSTFHLPAETCTRTTRSGRVSKPKKIFDM